jgi:hypothetical protein
VRLSSTKPAGDGACAVSFSSDQKTLLYSRLIHQIPQPTIRGPRTRRSTRLRVNPDCGSDTSIASTAHKKTQRTDIRIHIFVFLATPAPDLHLRHTADSENLQRPLQPHTATPYSLADAAGAQRDAIVFCKPLADLLEREIGFAYCSVNSM